MDVIVVKKFAPYYLEETLQNPKRKHVLRSKKSMERLRTLRMLSLEDQFTRELDRKFPNKDFIP